MNANNTQFNTNLFTLLEDFLAELSEREKDIIQRRFQLKNISKKETLKQIGDDYNITRERVRQIEKDSIKKIKSQVEKSEKLLELSSLVEDFLKNHGGFAEEQFLLDSVLSILINEEIEQELKELNKKVIHFIIDQLFDQFLREEENEHFHSVWKLNLIEAVDITDFVREISKSLEEHNKPLKPQEFIEYLTSHDSYNSRKELFNKINNQSNKSIEDILLAYIKSSKRIKQNLFDEWGLVDWSRIKPRKLSEKIDLILEKSTNPLHFNDIAEHINIAGFDRKNICPATVHNELISNDNYVLVGRGIYALKKWGFQDGTVLDVIVRVLDDSQNAMTKDEIFEQVLKQRMVKKATIYLALMNKEKFEKTENGQYKVKK